MEQSIQLRVVPEGFMKSLLAGAVVSFSFPIISSILHAMHYSSAASGGAGVIVVLLLGFVCGVLPSIRISFFIVGLLVAAMVWWAVLAIATDITVAMMSGTIFSILTILYGLVAFISGKVARFLALKVWTLRR